jgi:plastocyanin
VNLAIAAVIAIVAVVVILATSGGSDEPATEKPAAATPAPTTQPEASAQGQATSTPTEAPNEPAPPEIVVKDGKVVGGIAEFRVKQGDRIKFSVTADVADEVHVHAYDFMKDIEKPGDTVTFDFKADITGITEVELEDSELQIASLRVDP